LANLKAQPEKRFMVTINLFGSLQHSGAFYDVKVRDSRFSE